MISVKFQSVVHRGRIAAAGFFFDASIVDEQEARKRILSVWQTNSRVYRIPQGLVLSLPKPIQVEASQTIGLPLVRRNGRLVGMPMTETQFDSMSIPFESVVVLHGGVPTVEALNEAGRQAVHDWIDLDDLQFASGNSLGSDLATPTVTKPVELPSLRESLAKVPEAPELKSLLARLKGEREPVEANALGWRGGFSLLGLVSSFGRFFQELASLWPRSGTAAQSLTGSTTRSLVNQGPSKLSLWLDAVVGKIVRTTRLSRALGWRQGRYLSRVVEMFESGDVNEAMRHAIPLSAITDSPVLRTAFGLPGVRQDLRINPFGVRIASSVSTGPSLYYHLQQLYRETFKRLHTQGKIDEAAFVLAELLRSNEEAVAFLERHGRLREAAEIAEARELAAEIIVRQWFLAGNKERAIRIARKMNVFYGAVLRLEKSQHPAAAALRKIWAETLAEAGDVALAADVIWPLEPEREKAMEWTKQAVEMGGRSGARCLARIVGSAQSGHEEFLAKARKLLEDDSVEEAENRLEFAETIRKEPRSPSTQTISRLVVRAIVRDAGQGLPGLTAIQLRQLVDYSGDGALRADVPRQVSRAKIELKNLAKPRHYFLSANERGAGGISEAVLLPNGSCAVAMGEVGVKLITKDGRTIAHFDQPAEKLVVSNSGSGLILLARRGSVWCLSKVDLSSRKVARWCDAEIGRFTTSFAGATWYVVISGDLYAIDTTSKRLDALWRIPDLGHFVGPMTLAPNKLNFVTYENKEFWLWEYRAPQLRLNSKTQLSLPRPLECFKEVRLCSLPETGVLDCSTLVESGCEKSDKHDGAPNHSLLLRSRDGSWNEFLFLSEDEELLGEPVVGLNWIALCVGSKTRTRVLVHSYAKSAKPTRRLEIEMEGECRPAVRIEGTLLTVSDDLGRLHAYELNYGERVRNFTL